MSTDFLSDGKHYDLLINWEKRLLNEIPFIIKNLGEIDPKINTILEVGCGTGRHTEKLIPRYKMTGVDINSSMIEEAMRRVPKAELISDDFMKTELLEKRSFDAIISLGNTIGLIAQFTRYELIIQRVYSLLRKSMGLLIFQILNMEKERNGWSPPRSIRTSEGEYTFLREFRTTPHHIYLQILTLFRAPGESDWAFHSMGPTTIPRIGHKAMLKILEESGFTHVKFFGGYQSEVFDPDSSIDLIIVAFT